jgi:hypothetical protein
MKNQTTNIAFVMAIRIATTKFHSPRSRKDTATVVAVSSMSAMKTSPYERTGTT